MRKNTTLPLIIAGLGLAAAAAPAFAQDYGSSAATPSRWDGFYAGVKGGVNDASASGVSNKTSYTGGIEAGYQMNLNGPVVGADVFADMNPNEGHAQGVTYGTHVYGADFKVGLDNGPIMPYAKIGYADVHGTGDLTGSGSGFHGGLGVEYIAYSHLGVAGEWTYDRASFSGATVKNNNFTVGVNYHF
ncbi:MAG TPA: porin family protein [Acidiferrobacteraceae bacterium]|nr:porin family protein [Acidiferrobacteraceae bacterium]